MKKFDPDSPFGPEWMMYMYARNYDNNYVPRDINLKINNTAKKIYKYMEKRKSSLLPNAVNNINNALIYIAIVNHEISGLADDDKEIFVRSFINDASQAQKARTLPPDYDWCQLLCKGMDCPPIVTALVLGDYLNMSPENIFERFPPTQDDSDVRDKLCCPDIPSTLSAGGVSFRLQQVVPIRHSLGRILQKICLYSNGEESVIVYAGEATNFGRKPLPARLPASHLMTTYERTIHICLCADIAWKYTSVAHAGNLSSQTGIIVTGCFKDIKDFDALDLKIIAHHKVVLLCSPDRCEWDELEKIIKICEKNYASSISIFPYYFSPSREYSNLANKRTLPAPILARIENELKGKEWSESRDNLAYAIGKYAIPFKELDDFKRKIGLKQECGDDPKFRSSESGIKYYDKDLAHSSPHENDECFDLSQMITQDCPTLIYAPSNAGKSFCGLQLAITLVSGTPSFCFSCSKNRKVIVLDGEMGDMFHRRLYQLAGGDEKLLYQVKMMLGQYNVRSMNLHNEEIRNQVIQKILDENPEIVFIDNIISIFPKSVRGSLDDFNDFIRQLNDNHISIVTLHHTDKQGKGPMGASELVDLAQNIIHIKGKEELANEYKKCKDTYKLADTILNLNGAFIDLYIEKCKIYPQLEHSDNYYFLPYDGRWVAANLNGDNLLIPGYLPSNESSEEEHIEDKHSNIEQVNSSDIGICTYPQVSVDELTVLKKVKNDTKITNKDVQSLLNCSDSKATKLLTRLVEKGVLESVGKGRGTYYTVSK